MLRTVLLASTALLTAAGAAQAQSAPSVQPQAEAGQQGVLVFTPDFFADQRPNTALDMVSRVPGFSVNDGDGGRGFEGAVGNVLINGARPASKTDTGSNALSRVLATQVERIELIRGGAPGIDMQGFTVVANVILKTTSSTEQILQVDAGLFEGGRDRYAARYQFTKRDGDRTWGFVLADGISIDDSQGMGRVLRVAGDGTVLRDETVYTDSWGGAQAGRLNYSGPLFGGKIDATTRIGVDDFHNLTRQTAPGVLRESFFDNEGSQGELGLTYTRNLSDTMRLETRFIHEGSTFEGVETSNSTVGAVSSPEARFVSEGDASETIARALVRYERSPRLTFEVGAEVAYNMLDTQQAYSEGGVNIPLPSATVMVEETRGELFGKGTWRVRDDLTLEGGVRLEASTISQSGDAEQEENFFFAKPRFLATWTPGEGHQVRFRFERELGQLDFGDFAASADLDDGNVFGGNVNLRPEQRWISELTYERRFWGEGIVSIGYRHDEIVDAIDRIPLDGGLSAVGNIGDGTLDQLVLNVVVPMDRAGFSGGRFTFRNTWNHTEVTDPTTGETRPISGVRASQPTFVISQDITSWKINWSVAYLSRLGQTTYRPDDTFAWVGKDYFELAAEWKATPTLSLRAQLNIWDNFDMTRTVYANRTTRPINFIETRETDPRTFLQLRLRKTF